MVDFGEENADGLGKFRDLQFLGANVFLVHFDKRLVLCNVQPKPRRLVLESSLEQLVLCRRLGKMMVCDSKKLRATHSFEKTMTKVTRAMDYPLVEKVRLFGVDRGLYVLTLPSTTFKKNLDIGEHFDLRPEWYHLLYNPEFDLSKWRKTNKKMHTISKDKIFNEMFKEIEKGSLVFSSRYRLLSVKVIESEKSKKMPEKSEFIVCIGTSEGKCHKLKLELDSKNQLVWHEELDEMPELPINPELRKKVFRRDQPRSTKNSKSQNVRSQLNNTDDNIETQALDDEAKGDNAKSGIDKIFKGSSVFGKSGLYAKQSTTKKPSLLRTSKDLIKSDIVGDAKGGIVNFEQEEFKAFGVFDGYKDEEEIREEPSPPPKEAESQVPINISSLHKDRMVRFFKEETKLQAEVEESDLVIHDFICDGSVDVVVFCARKSQSRRSKKIYLCIKPVRSKNWLKMETSLEAKSGKSVRDKWQIKIQTRISNVLYFYLASSKGIFQFSVREILNRKKLNLKQYFRKDSFDPSRFFYNDEIILFAKHNLKKIIDPEIVCYSKQKEQFLVPISRGIEVYSRKFEHMIYSLAFENEVKLLVLDDENGVMLVYDSHCYYEVDMMDYNVTYRQPFVQKRLGLQFPVNVEHFPSDQAIRLDEFNGDVVEVSFVEKYEHFNLFKFPLYSLLHSVSSFDNHTHIMEFAKYYFARLATFNNEDHVFGVLSPLLFAICSKKPDLLRTLLETYGYPQSVSDYKSPLSFAAEAKRSLEVQVICDYLIARNCQVEFSHEDFRNLLESSQSQCHSLMATIPSKMTGQGLPLHINLKQSREIFHFDSVSNFIQKVKSEIGLKVKKRSKMQEVDFYELGFDYSFKSGTYDSIRFIYTYSESKSNPFVLSIWEQLIQWKWKRLRLWLLPYILVYLTFAVCTTMYFVFKQTSGTLQVFFICSFVFLLAYETFQICMMSRLKLGGYFKDKFNFLDIFILLFTMVNYGILSNIAQLEGWRTHVDQTVGTVLMILIYFRLFTFLRMIGQFSILVGMISTIIIEIVPYLIILLYFLIVSILLALKIDVDYTFSESLIEMYVYGLFGGVDGDAFGSQTYKFIPVVFTTMLIAVVLMNIMIAYLSNLFSALEENQKIIELQQKASLILEVEILHYLFKMCRCKCRKKKPNRKKLKAGDSILLKTRDKKKAKGKKKCSGCLSKKNKDKSNDQAKEEKEKERLFIILKKNAPNMTKYNVIDETTASDEVAIAQDSVDLSNQMVEIHKLEKSLNQFRGTQNEMQSILETIQRNQKAKSKEMKHIGVSIEKLSLMLQKLQKNYEEFKDTNE